MRDMNRLGGPFLSLLAQVQLLFFLTFPLKVRWIGVFYRRYLPKLVW